MEGGRSYKRVFLHSFSNATDSASDKGYGNADNREPEDTGTEHIMRGNEVGVCYL